MSQAWPTFADFVNDNITAASAVTDCINKKKDYQSYFGANVSANIYNDWIVNATIGDKGVVWSRYVFEEGVVGLTASRVITDPSTKQILAVAAVDYTLADLGSFLSQTVDKDSWRTWLFDSSSNHSYEMIASSTGSVCVSEVYFFGFGLWFAFFGWLCVTCHTGHVTHTCMS